jgi:hypothetical protein
LPGLKGAALTNMVALLEKVDRERRGATQVIIIIINNYININNLQTVV